ncbi:HipA N-terminal domain-containing protein [Marinimicrobium sp. ABcell2]|uniref:HipA N-terminal domain-containing protein n=1 Tax=Marinimicrobium sp. ABcell2 TaxID=3069751 RepID=UPI0027B69105|nr:HipA N-terminal domain-containing protein [Marinimicrobium sp. ABcell2]MDQ2077431.1 HipA N-terminal domain-containing protein [Marinimicrobium sp. ABcell2]
MSAAKKGHRRGRVYLAGVYAGDLEEIDTGYRFTYADTYRKTGTPIGYLFPTDRVSFEFTRFPPLFDNLVSEGWMRHTHSVTQKISETDRFGLLLNNGADLTGAITVEKAKDDE